MIKLYQKSPLKNILRGLVLQLLTFCAVFYLEKFLLGNMLYQFCESNPYLQRFGLSFEDLIHLPDSLVFHLFLFYWLNQYIDQHIRKIEQPHPVKQVCYALVLILLNLSSNVVEALLPTAEQGFAQIVGDFVLLGYSLLVKIFLYAYLLYRALGLPRDQALRYKQFVPTIFRFIKEKLGLLLANIGAYFAIVVAAIVVLFGLLLTGVDIWPLLTAFPHVYIAGQIVIIVTIVVPLTEAKLYTAFAEFFMQETSAQGRTE